MPTVWPNVDAWDVQSSIDAGDLDCVNTALGRLYEQFAGRANWTALVTVIGQTFQSLEDLSNDVVTQTSIGTAEGIHLDWIGSIVGRRRNGLADDDYRRAIIARGVGLAQDGSIRALLEAIETITGAPGAMIGEIWPAKISVTLGDTFTLAELEIIATALRDAVADGVGIAALSNATAPPDSIDGGIDDAFVLDAEDGSVASADDLPIVIY